MLIFFYRLDLSEGPHEYSNKETGRYIDISVNQQSRREHKATSQLTVLVSETVDQDINSDGNAIQSTSNRSECTLFVQTKHPFVPLPVQLSNPLPLHKCPRSTLSPVSFLYNLFCTIKCFLLVLVKCFKRKTFGKNYFFNSLK